MIPELGCWTIINVPFLFDCNIYPASCYVMNQCGPQSCKLSSWPPSRPSTTQPATMNKQYLVLENKNRQLENRTLNRVFFLILINILTHHDKLGVLEHFSWTLLVTLIYWIPLTLCMLSGESLARWSDVMTQVYELKLLKLQLFIRLIILLSPVYSNEVTVEISQ